MTDRVSCTVCGAKILLDTAEKNGGLCMPCKGGYRKNIEASKLRYELEKEYRESPARKYWVWLVSQVHKSEKGFAGLSPENQLYFAASLVEGEVYNGGFDQYFFNSSADYYSYAVRGLTEMGALESCRLLVQAKELYFGESPVPETQASRIEFLRASAAIEDERSKKVEDIDRMFWKDLDGFQQCAVAFAKKYGLHAGF
jgi:hypothetical protein